MLVTFLLRVPGVGLFSHQPANDQVRAAAAAAAAATRAKLQQPNSIVNPPSLNRRQTYPPGQNKAQPTMPSLLSPYPAARSPLQPSSQPVKQQQSSPSTALLSSPLLSKPDLSFTKSPVPVSQPIQYAPKASPAAPAAPQPSSTAKPKAYVYKDDYSDDEFDAVAPAKKSNPSKAAPQQVGSIIATIAPNCFLLYKLRTQPIFRLDLHADCGIDVRYQAQGLKIGSAAASLLAPAQPRTLQPGEKLPQPRYERVPTPPSGSTFF